MNALMLLQGGGRAAAVRRAAAVSRRGMMTTADYAKVSEGWSVQDIQDFIQPGKYSVQTFNKISPKVRKKE
jgi:hypothetical protein